MSKDSVKILIPKKADYISIIRLAISGIAYTRALSLDQLEDIKVSVSEACINSLMFNKGEEISMEFEINKDSISIEINGVIEEIPEDLEERRERELGILIIKSLMDQVEFSNSGLRMTKYIEDDIL